MNAPSPLARPPSRFPPVVKTLLIVNAIIFIAQTMGWNAWLTQYFALWPAYTPELARMGSQVFAVPQFEFWQLLSYGFLHGSMSHIFFNLLAMWMFGAQIENSWGSRRFATYYFVCVIGAGLTQLIVVTFFSHQIVPTLGASGGVFGILLAFGMMFPNRLIVLLIPPIPIKAKWFVIFYGALELFLGVTGTASGVAHFAHLGGMVFGFLLLMYWSFQVRT
ncbi:MAG: rhomboid family intramembrane serine protease [Pseudomonadota bacterium]